MSNRLFCHESPSCDHFVDDGWSRGVGGEPDASVPGIGTRGGGSGVQRGTDGADGAVGTGVPGVPHLSVGKVRV